MKTKLLFIIIMIICLLFTSCGSVNNEKDEEESGTDEVFTVDEYDFDITLNEDFGLSPVFVKRDYDNLPELEDDFLGLLKDCVDKAKLGTFNYEYNDTLRKQREYIKNTYPDIYAESELANSAIAYGEGKEIDEDLEVAEIRTGISISKSGDYYYHFVDFNTCDYVNAESCNLEDLKEQVATVTGVVIGSDIIQEALEKVENKSRQTDDIVSVEQEITVKKDDHKDNVYIEVEGWYDEGSCYLRMQVSRSRRYL